MPSTRDALDYLARGWSVIPCCPPDHAGCSKNHTDRCKGNNRGKTPLLSSWSEYQGRLPTEEEVRKWWQRWPTANIAVLTGKLSGIIVLDVDSAEGEEVVQKLGLPATAVSKTSKGRHYIFKHPGAETSNAAKILDNKVDFRGDGGYIIAPPSVHASGHVYEWEP